MSALPREPSARAAASADAADAAFQPHVPGVDYGVLDGLVGYGVRRAQIVIYEDFVRTLSPWNITPQRFSALTVISRNPRLKLTELARILGIARSGAVLVVDALAAMDYVLRVPSPQDRRAYGLALTATGEADLVRITAAVFDHDQRMVAGMSLEETQQLTRLLRRVAGPRAD